MNDSRYSNEKTCWDSFRAGVLFLLGWAVVLMGLSSIDWSVFIWGDVAFVFLIGALPMGTVLTRKFSPGLNALQRGIIGVGLMVVPFLLPDGQLESHWGVRLGFAVCYTTGLLLGMLSILPMIVSHLLPRFSVGWLLLSVLILVLPTTIYSRFRSQREQERLGALIDQTRIGEADIVAQKLVKWDPQLMWRERSLRLSEQELRRLVVDLSQKVETPLGQSATTAERIERARTLAILGRTQESLDVLGTIVSESLSVTARNLVATIHESREEWSEASDWYQLALAGSLATPLTLNTSEDAEILRAWRGIGYSERKLGNLDEAEFAYLELLKRSPVAEHYFIMGKFYEDIQRTVLAKEHIQRAIELDADRYGDEGRRLMQRLVTGHFGCFEVYRGGAVSNSTGK